MENLDDREIKHDGTTRGIKNCRDCRLFKGCSPLQLLCNLTGNHPQSATFHTATVANNSKKMRYSQIREGDKFGICENMTNATIIPPIYDLASPEIYNDKLILVTNSGKVGFVDFDNRIVIPIIYEAAREFKDGLAPVRINDSWGYINRKNQIEIQPNPDWKWVTLFENDVAVVRLNDHDYFYIDRLGNYLHNEPFSAAGDFQDGFAIAARGNQPYPFNNELQIINRNFQFVIDEKYNQIKYLEKNEFKVVKRLDDKGREKTGTLKIGGNVVWNQESERLNDWLNKIENLKSQFVLNLEKEQCFCQFPRIVDYITHRAHYDKDIMRNIAIEKLDLVDKKDLGAYEGDLIYKCKKCNSEYLLMIRNNPRGEPDTAGFKQIKDCCNLKIGEIVSKDVPTAVIHYGPRGYDGELWLEANSYFDTVDNLIDYLFKKTTVGNRVDRR
jgi:hypothetical protein